MLGMYGVRASLEMIQEAGIEHVAERVLMLAGVAIGDLQERGFTLSASTAPEHRSGIVIPEVANPVAACAKLEAAGIICIPRGRGVRIAPHFYNTEEEVLRVGKVLSAL